jgi:hypothetical protein
MNRVNQICGFAVMSWVVFSAAIACGDGAEVAQGDSLPQPKAALAASAATCHCIGEEKSSVVEHIKMALASPLKPSGIEFTDMPLDQVVNLLQEEYNIPIQLDVAALKDAGVNLQDPITVNLRNVTLRSALRLMLKQHQLTYIIANEVLIITTPEQAESQLLICVYDVRDLINGGGDVKGETMLIQAITSCVARESWAANNGGPAEIRPLIPGLMVVSQTQAVHDEIRGLLDAARQIRHQTVTGEVEFGRRSAGETTPFSE